MINSYIWELYKKSEGKTVIESFEKGLTECISNEYISMIKLLRDYYTADKKLLNHTEEQLLELEAMNKLPDDSSTDAETEYERLDGDVDTVFSAFYDMWLNDNNNDDKAVFDGFSWGIERISTVLAYDYPEYCIPYYFYNNYNVLTIIADAYDIPLPVPPKKSDYKARTWFYVELCKVLHEFKAQNNLSLYELCAFLYDFAPKSIGGVKSYIVNVLPEPKSAFFIGGGGNNGDEIAEDNPDNICFWQCNPDTRVGDMIVMYLRTPISSISSIWRARSVGFIDPFFWYYRCTYIGNPVKIKRIPLTKIKKDKVLKEMPIVSKNMQGINGIELMPSKYNYIVENSKVEVPRLEYVIEGHGGTFKSEKEVENQLIKHLIKKLGYGEDEYRQQYYMEIGNHNYALIPDFVLSPVISKGHYSGYAIIEAKRSITTSKQLEDTKTQARSYAKMVGAKYSAIASQEGIWVTSAEDDYTKEVFQETWDNLSNEDVLYKLKQLIGNKK